MNSERIKEIQESTAYPESKSVQLALLQVWHECASECQCYKEQIEMNAIKKLVHSALFSIYDRDKHKFSYADTKDFEGVLNRVSNKSEAE